MTSLSEREGLRGKVQAIYVDPPYGILFNSNFQWSTSVGQQQRVAVARALIGQPPLIVADEPPSSRDAGSQAAFLDLMSAQLAAAGTSLPMVSHDPRLGARFDRVVRVEDIATSGRKAA